MTAEKESFERTLEFYKQNAEEDYIKTPISVLRYISELENFIKEEKEKKEYLDSVYQEGLAFWEEHLPNIEFKFADEATRKIFEG